MKRLNAALIFSFVLAAITTFSIFSPAAEIEETDPLTLGPLAFSEESVAAAREAYKDSLIFTDEQCHLSQADVAETEVPLSRLQSTLCFQRDRELMFQPRRRTLVGCLKGRPRFAMKASIGSNGMGKMSEGDRKSPIGTYWLGYPRASKLFGIFIPIGFPNAADVKAGRTGNALGIHGPMRFMTCLPRKSLEMDWTAGCFALARDSQIIALSDWVLAQWPVKMTILPD